MWRDAIKPSEILAGLCKDIGLDPPIYSNNTCSVAGRQFYADTFIEQESGENCRELVTFLGVNTRACTNAHTHISPVSVENLVTAFEIFFRSQKIIYFYLKSDPVYRTVCQEKTRNKAFTKVCIFFDFSKKYIQCLFDKICLTKNCPCRYEVFHGHRRFIYIYFVFWTKLYRILLFK